MFPLPPPIQRQRGFSLPELLVAMVIGLVLLAGLSTMFVTNSKAQAETEKSNRQVENGRYAISLLAGDIRHAGFYGEFDPRALGTPATMPDACAIKVDDLKTGLPLPIQGVDNATAGTLSACLQDIKVGTDIVVVRRTGTCVLEAAGCDTLASGVPYFQAALCNDATELLSGDAGDFYRLDTVQGNMTRHQRDCTTLAVLRRYKVDIYFVANNDVSGDNIPTLKRAELTSAGGQLAFSISSQVDGIDNMQIEYGMDTNSDGAPDLFTANPTTYAGCATDACAITNWQNVVAAKFNILARNVDSTKGYADQRSYTLGLTAAGQPNTVPATGDAYKRHVFQSQIVLLNPAGRKAP